MKPLDLIWLDTDKSVDATRKKFDRGCVEGLYPTLHIHETNDCIYNGYDNMNLEPNAMINIDTVAHMNMHYTQY